MNTTHTENKQLKALLEEQQKTNKLLQQKLDRPRNWIIFKLCFWSALIVVVIVLIFMYAPAYTGNELNH